MSAELDPHGRRFGLLADLCYELGRRQRCTSMLVHPGLGEAVLYVPIPARPGRCLGIAAVDHQGRWLYAFGDEWSVTGDLARTAARVAWLVDGR